MLIQSTIIVYGLEKPKFLVHGFCLIHAHVCMMCLWLCYLEFLCAHVPWNDFLQEWLAELFGLVVTDAKKWEEVSKGD